MLQLHSLGSFCFYSFDPYKSSTGLVNTTTSQYLFYRGTNSCYIASECMQKGLHRRSSWYRSLRVCHTRQPCGMAVRGPGSLTAISAFCS
jgi:hypothetical protein